MQQRISIIGAGPSGFALAADLESRGILTVLYSHPTHLRHAHDVTNRGHLLKGYVPRITCSMAETLEFSDLVMITVPSTGQSTILGELRSHDTSIHTFVAIPGNMFSLLAPELRIFETNLSPFSCRMNDGELIILGRKKLIYMTGPPDEKLNALFNIKWCHNSLEVCLSNINGVFHPIMMLLNVGRIGTDFNLYSDGLTRHVARAMEAIDRVRVEIGDAFGFKLNSVVQVSNECYDQTFTDLVDLAKNSPPHNKLKAPMDTENRNISEDVPDLLVCWHQLALKLGVDSTPLLAVIVMAEMTTGKDYMNNGRTLKKLGIDHLSREQLIEKFGARS